MRILILLAAGIVLVGAAITLLFVFDSEGTNEDSLAGTTGTGDHRSTGGRSDQDREVDLHPSGPDRPGNGTSLSREIVAGTPFLEGDVRDGKTGEPVDPCRVAVYRATNGGRSSFLLETAFSGKNGHFRIALNKGGEYRLLFSSSRHITREIAHLDVPDDAGLAGLTIELDPGAAVSGRVVADRTGLPVTGALVVWAGRLESDLESILFGKPENCVHARTDRDGRFTLSGLRGDRSVLSALHYDYAEAVRAVHAGERDVEIRLDTGFRAFGTALDNSGSPCPGVIVTLTGGGIPHALPVLTARDGSFRSYPARPGRVNLSARLPTGSPVSSSFSQETKSVVLVDRDVEVRFGPEPEQVTWRGVLYDGKGDPVPEGRVSVLLFRAGQGASPPVRIQRSAVTDAAGRFELFKLIPDRFRVDLEFPSPRSTLRWCDVEFDSPGVTERDIRIEGATIEGLVVDGATGLPFQRGGCSVWARESSGRSTGYRAEVENDGRFCIRGLDPGNYILIAGGIGLVETRIPGIDIEEGQVKDGLRIVIPEGGRFDLALVGFESQTNERFELSVSKDGAARPVYRRYHTIEPDIDNTISLLLEPGVFTVRAAFESLGLAERRFEIETARTTTVRLTRHDFVLFSGTVTLTGRLIRRDGRAVEKAYLEFTGRDVPGAEPNRSIKGKTDPEGRFAIEGFRPGRWKVAALVVPSRFRVFLPDVILPELPSDPFLHDLEIAAGTISATLRDSGTGLVFDDESARWRARLLDTATSLVVAELDGERSGSSIELEGVPAGRFRLEVQAASFEHYLSGVIELGEGESRNIGEVALKPAAIIVLTVEDPDGRPIEKPRITFPRMTGSRRPRPVAPGKADRYFLPTPGAVRIRISAAEFEEREMSVEVEPGQTRRIRVVLDRKGPGS